MRNLTIAAALLMGSTSVLAQATQPTTSQPATAADAAAAQTIGGGTPATPTGAVTAMPAADPAVSATAETATPAADATMTATAEPEAAAPMASGATAAPIATASAGTTAEGALTPLEFAMHVDSSNTALTAEAKRERFSRASGNGAIKLLNATAADFSKADTNQDRKVDQTELAAWSGSASSSAAPAATMTSGAGEMTPLPNATSDTAEPAPTGATMTPSDVSDAPEGQQADDTMATDTPPQN